MTYVISATLISGVFFTASVVSAQTSGGVSPEVGMRPQDPYREIAFPDAKSRGGQPVVSTDVLRHPLAEKPRRLIEKALKTMNAGDHEGAIEQLRNTLAKFPDAAAYAQPLLGVEYMRTNQFPAAVSSLEKATQSLPHDAVTRYNFGLSLVCAGDVDRGTQEVRRALELDPKNPTMQALLTLLLHSRSDN